MLAPMRSPCTYKYISAESARLVHPWHLRGRTVQLTCGTVQLFFDFLLHLIYFCYKFISIFLWGSLFFPDDTQIQTTEDKDYRRTVYLLLLTLYFPASGHVSSRGHRCLSFIPPVLSFNFSRAWIGFSNPTARRFFIEGC